MLSRQQSPCAKSLAPCIELWDGARPTGLRSQKLKHWNRSSDEAQKKKQLAPALFTGPKQSLRNNLWCHAWSRWEDSLHLKPKSNNIATLIHRVFVQALHCNGNGKPWLVMNGTLTRQSGLLNLFRSSFFDFCNPCDPLAHGGVAQFMGAEQVRVAEVYASFCCLLGLSR